jgi:two-component system, response regulator RegA
MLASKLGLEVEWVSSIDAASVAMKGRHFEALMLDLELSEDGCLEFLESIELHPTMPHVVAIVGSGRLEVGFRLAQLGVRAVLRKPVDPRSLALALDGIFTQPPNLRGLVRSSVGLIGVRVMMDLIRSEMVAEALARSRGSRRGAASMLRISRQLLQHIMRAEGSERTQRGLAKVTR